MRKDLKTHTCKQCWQRFPDREELIKHKAFAPEIRQKPKRGRK